MKYLIVSSSGDGNTGDDLIAHALTGMVARIDPKSDIKIIRPAPFDAHLCLWADAILVGGGGILYDHDVVRENLHNYMFYVDAAHVQKKPAYLIGVGEQGITTAFGRAKYHRDLRKAKLITARSRQDADNLNKIIGGRPKVKALQDLVFDLKFTSPRRRLNGARIGRPTLGFCLSNLSGQGQQLHRLASRHKDTGYAQMDPSALAPLFKDFRVKMICHSRDDLSYYEELTKLYGSEIIYYDTYKKAPKVFKSFAQCDLILTGRFHGLVVAALLNKPTVTVGLAGQKLDRLIVEGLPSLRRQFYTPQKLIDDDLPSLLGSRYSQGKIKPPKLAEVRACQELAHKNEDYLLKALQRDFGDRLS